MRILHTIDSAGIYGAESMLLSLAGEQQLSGHHPVILSLGNLAAGQKAIEVDAAARGVPCIPFRMRNGLNLRGAAELLALARRDRFDIIHSHGYKTNILLGAKSRAARGLPVVTTLHGWTATRTFSKLGLYRLLDQCALRRLDAVVIVSEKMRDVPAVHAIGDRLHAIPNGIALPREAGTQPLADTVGAQLEALKARDAILIGGVGRLSAEKNFGALIRALALLSAELPRLHIVILGDGPQAGEMRALAETCGLRERVHLLGYVPDARKYLRCFDLLAIPSLTEGLPMTLLEAMAIGVPVIGTRVGQIPEALGDAGLIVQPGDVPALANAIRLVSTKLPEYRAAAARGMERVRSTFSATIMASRYEQVYQSVLGETRS